MILKINPTQLDNSKHNKILYHFLMQNKDKNYFVKDIVNKVIINNREYSFTLTHDILHRKRESDVYQDRFEIVANQPEVNKGGFGEIILFEGTLVPTPDETLIFKITFHVWIKNKASTKMILFSIGKLPIKKKFFTTLPIQLLEQKHLSW